MAIDLIAIPLSKHSSGDYISPMMQWAWDQGVPYEIHMPGGKIREFPKDVPFGGPDSAKKRMELIPSIQKIINAFPQGISGTPWDETSDAPPQFFRVDTVAFESLLNEAKLQFTKPVSLFERLRGKRSIFSHLSKAGIFLPVAFPEVFMIERMIFGSLFTVKSELNNGAWSPKTEAAFSITREAVDAALSLKMPLVVDY